MFNRIHSDLDSYGRELRYDLIRNGLEDAARHFETRSERTRREERAHRCMVWIHRIVCWAIIICAAALILNKVCNFCKPKEVKQQLDDEQKELYKKLAKIKGRTAR